MEFTLNKETGISEKGIGYHYISSGIMKSIFPIYGEGGTVVEIRGDDFKPSFTAGAYTRPLLSSI
jgi:hypothetical protein